MRRQKAPPRLTVSQWADEHRYLSPEASAEPGRWDTARAEYQRAIMDAIADVLVAIVVVIKSAQVGWTEILNNVVGYYMDQDPAPMLVVQPTVAMGEAWSKDRLAPMLRDSPALRNLVGDARSRDGGNTLLHKSFTGGHLTIAGANSAASLASRPIRILLCDEVDRYPASAGSEGDPVDLARKRTTTFWNRKTLIGSTPTIAGVSRIEAEWEKSDKRRFWIPCPHCAERQVLAWELVRWDGDDAATAAYYCRHCGVAWTNAQRWAAVRLGEWRAEKPLNGIAGFHINELYSPWRKIEETVADFLAAKGSPETLKVWKNTALGETWQEAGEAPEWERLLERREAMPMGVVPAWALVLTAGIDNQASPERLEAAVWAWGADYRSCLIHTEVVDGSPADAGVWDKMAAMLARDWPREGGGTMRIAKAAADTGGQHTSGVYTQLRRLRDPRIMPIKGVSGWNKASSVMGPTLVDITAGGKKIRRGLRLWTVAVDGLKSEFYRQLWLTRPESGEFPPGWVHLPEGVDAEQVKQLVAEQLVTVKTRNGFARREWQKTRANEQLDMRVYARAALSVLGSDRYGERFWASLRKGLDQPAAEPAAEPVPQQVSIVAVGPVAAAAVVDTQTPVKRSLVSRLAR